MIVTQTRVVTVGQKEVASFGCLLKPELAGFTEDQKWSLRMIPLLPLTETVKTAGS